MNVTEAKCKRCHGAMDEAGKREGEVLCQGCFNYLMACLKARETALSHGLQFYPDPNPDHARVLSISFDPLRETFLAPGKSWELSSQPLREYVYELWRALKAAEWPE